MSKQKMGKVIQMLSPENFIRKKARNLPIYECLVNTEWKEEGIAQVIVARKHTNGNVTVCIYIVDLFCLGVKQTQYLFNISETEYREKTEGLENVELESISYTLAHNIVFAGLEYAEEYGFKPHKEFTSITKFMLEEDTEDIELIDIECGKNGKPFYISGPYEDQVTRKKILAQLERSAGPGNYEFLLQVDDDIEKDNELDDFDEFDRMNFKEQRELFLKLYANHNDLSDDEDEQLRLLTEHVVANMVSPELVDQYTEEYLDDFDFEITDDDFTAEMLGIVEQKLSVGTCELFTQVYETAIEDPEAAKLLLNDFRNETPENPASYFLELSILRGEGSPEYEKKVEEYYSRFPEYSLLKILMISSQFASLSTEEEAKKVEAFTMQSFFAGRTWIHHIEVFNYLTALLMGLTKMGDMERIQGLYEAYNNLELTDVEIDVLDEYLFIVKSAIVEQIFLMEGKA